MKSVKTFFCLFCCLSSLFALEDHDTLEEATPQVRNTYIHIDLGTGPYPLPIPSLALGVRNQWNHSGFDVSLYGSTVFFITQVKLTASYLFYFFPDLQSEFYVGGGLGGSALFERKKHYEQSVICLSPEVLIGREYISELGLRRFFQVQISMPTYIFGRLKTLSTKHHGMYFPLIILTYGIGF